MAYGVWCWILTILSYLLTQYLQYLFYQNRSRSDENQSHGGTVGQINTERLLSLQEAFGRLHEKCNKDTDNFCH
jgi:hypothetical protein